MHWSSSFYAFQEQLTGCYSAPTQSFHRVQAARITDHLTFEGRLLELGAGGGQFAVSAAELGHSVTAIELLPEERSHLLERIQISGLPVRAIQGDFYEVEVAGSFDAVCYWDGFGIGEDADQRRLLARIARWLAPSGRAYIDIFTPWYWARRAGEREIYSTFGHEYGFDADGCRMLDTYWAQAEAELKQTQSLRCYSPADLRLLLEDTGLTLTDTWPGGAFDTSTRTWHPEVPLGDCMSYTAVLSHA